MGADKLIDHWIQHLGADPEWAFRAYRRLLESLTPEIQERLKLRNERAEPYVVVFGKTQVGKTTLLLELMGIAPEHLAAVSKVLRGRQDTGRSATATAMEYCRSESNRWGLHRQSDMFQYESDDAMRDALAQLRQDMEAGRLLVHSPCVVHIPQHFFINEGETVSARILDLPGDHPANEVEQQHVQHMARTYLPFADLILLVGRADDLNFLQPGVISLPGIDDWQSMPRRFRVVTTYSYSAQSVRNLIRQDTHFDAAKRRKRLIEQIERFGSLSDAAKEENLYFPLEFGTSWREVQKNDPELYERMAPIIDELRKNLLKQIKMATSQVGRIRSALDTHLDIRSLHERRRLAIEIAIVGLADRESKRLDEMRFQRGAIKRAIGKIRSARTVFEDHSIVQGQSLLQEAMEPILQRALPGPSDEGKNHDRTNLQRMIVQSYAELCAITLEPKPDPEQDNAVRSFWASSRRRLTAPEPWEIRQILDDKFGEIREQLDAYFLDRYVFSDNYIKDKEAVLNAHKVALKAVLQSWIARWEDALWATRLERKKTLKQLKLALINLMRQRAQTVRLHRSVMNDLREHQQALINLDTTMLEDLERCQQYLRLLDEEYLTELQHSMNCIVGAVDDIDALTLALGSSALVQQRATLLEMSKIRLLN